MFPRGANKNLFRESPSDSIFFLVFFFASTSSQFSSLTRATRCRKLIVQEARFLSLRGNIAVFNARLSPQSLSVLLRYATFVYIFVRESVDLHVMRESMRGMRDLEPERSNSVT